MSALRRSPDGVYAPLARYPLQLVKTAVGELDPRAGDQILDRSGDEDLARTGECRNAGARVHRDPAHRVARELDLAGVNARAHLQPELRVAEAVVLALAREDAAGGSAVRRWLDEDEYLVRRRVHRDMKQALTGIGV